MIGFITDNLALTVSQRKSLEDMIKRVKSLRELDHFETMAAQAVGRQGMTSKKHDAPCPNEYRYHISGLDPVRTGVLASMLESLDRLTEEEETVFYAVKAFSLMVPVRKALLKVRESDRVEFLRRIGICPLCGDDKRAEVCPCDRI